MTLKAELRKKANKAYHNAKNRCGKPGIYQNIKFLFPAFDIFLDHVGLPKNSSESLDRINPNGHYEPGNVRWANAALQAANKKKSSYTAHMSLERIVLDVQRQARRAVDRKVVARAWDLVVRSFSPDIPALSGECEARRLAVDCWKASSFTPHSYRDFARKGLGCFHLPALSAPDEKVRLRGGPFKIEPEMPEVEKSRARSYYRRGLVAGLGELPLKYNLSSGLRELLLAQIQAGDTTWVHASCAASRHSGGVEGKLLCFASRLHRKMGSDVVYLPMQTLLERIDGCRRRYDEDRTLVADVMFVPDAQVDAVDGWRTSKNELYTLSDLVEFRRKNGWRTHVVIQSPMAIPSGRPRMVLFSNAVVSDLSQTS